MRRQLLAVPSAALLCLALLAGCAAEDARAPELATTGVTTVPSSHRPTATIPSSTIPTTPSTTIPGTTTPPPSPTTAPTSSTPSSAPTTTPTTAPPSSPPDDGSAPDPSELHPGDEGPLVEAVQERLTELGFWLDEIDGVFGPSTHHAVVAYQKAAGLTRDGIVGPATQAALADGVVPRAASTSGRAVEIDLNRQLLLIVTDGEVDLIFDTSTGVRAGTTPTGEWTISREIDGLRTSTLGLLYRPKYFYRGVAIHGYTSVPSVPASHGCVRVTYPAMDAIWEQALAPVGTPVWVY